MPPRRRELFEPKFLALPVESRLIDAEGLRGFDEAGCMFEHTPDVSLLELFQGDGRAGLGSEGCDWRVRGAGAQFGREIFGRDPIASSQNDGAFDGVAQFTQISGPGIEAEGRVGGLGEALEAPATLRGEVVQI